MSSAKAPDRIDRGLVMSSPVHDDSDKRAMYIPPWVRDDQRDDAETRRLQDEIVAAAERLKPPQPAPQPQRPPPLPGKDFQTRFNGDRSSMPKADSGQAPFDVEDAMRAFWQPSTLDPVTMPQPPKPKLSGPTWSMVSRLAGASGFAAVVALFVVGVIPLPSIDISMSRDNADANAAGPLLAAGAGNTRQPVATPPVRPTPVALATPSAAPQPAPPAATVGAAMNATSPFPAPPKPVVVEPQAPKPASALPEPRVLDFMSREEIDGLLKRGQDLIGTGDISGGRLLLTRAAEAGDPRASFALASTYDSAVVASLGVVGTFPDSVKARAWYAKAAEQGSTEAARRLEQPHLRQR